MRRTHSYRNLDGLHAERDAVPWYWRLAAILSSLMILGAYLMLPVTFDNDKRLRTSKAVIGIFAVALLTAGFSATGLMCFATPNPLFQADAIFLPALTSCIVGLLTIFYNFLISDRYIWNTQALLLTIAGALSTIAYTGLLIWTHRKIHLSRPRAVSIAMTPCPESDFTPSNHASFQSPEYYENYVRNMYPASAHGAGSPDLHAQDLSEDEMQRQQMLMLLLQRDEAPTPDPSSSTFRIDWQGGEGDDTPLQGYYAPGSEAVMPRAAAPRPGLHRQWTSDTLRPWDGVWRGVANRRQRPRSVEDREGRRREIELGR